MSSSDSTCPFCNIADAYPASVNPSADHERVSPSAFVVLSTPLCMAFLDIMPLSPGHMLVTTRHHHEKISDVGEEESKELGMLLPRLSRVLANVTGVWDVSKVSGGVLSILWHSRFFSLFFFWHLVRRKTSFDYYFVSDVLTVPALPFLYQAYADSEIHSGISCRIMAGYPNDLFGFIKYRANCCDLHRSCSSPSCAPRAFPYHPSTSTHTGVAKSIIHYVWKRPEKRA
jgi:hypothetical protein